MYRSIQHSCYLALLVTVLASQATAIGQQKGQPKAAAPSRAKQAPFTPVKDKPGLPRVLLLGDSISIGYAVPGQSMLSGKAYVHRAPTNCGPTT